MFRFLTKRLAAAVFGVTAFASQAQAQYQVHPIQIPPPPGTVVVGPTSGAATYSHNGTTASGRYATSGGTTVVTGGYRDANGSSASGTVRHNGRQVTGGGGYANPDGSGGSGYVTPNGGGFAYRDASGAGYGGQFESKDGDRRASGYYRTADGKGYCGGVAQEGGRTTLDGTYTRPGVIPGTVETTNGRVRIAGRDSSASGEHTISDPTGRVRLASGTAHLDRAGYTQSSSGGLGGIRAAERTDVRFRGANTAVTHHAETNAGGLVRTHQDYSVSRHGASAAVGVNQGGVKADVGVRVDRHGVSPTASIQVPTTQATQLPVPKSPLPAPAKVFGKKW